MLQALIMLLLVAVASAALVVQGLYDAELAAPRTGPWPRRRRSRTPPGRRSRCAVAGSGRPGCSRPRSRRRRAPASDFISCPGQARRPPHRPRSRPDRHEGPGRPAGPPRVRRSPRRSTAGRPTPSARSSR
ncbi:hypothetical protein LT493_16665 [Streptomyces tricolor]|nr:hypothetical protein [Streptomyces tricolor]